MSVIRKLFLGALVVCAALLVTALVIAAIVFLPRPVEQWSGQIEGAGWGFSEEATEFRSNRRPEVNRTPIQLHTHPTQTISLGRSGDGALGVNISLHTRCFGLDVLSTEEYECQDAYEPGDAAGDLNLLLRRGRLFGATQEPASAYQRASPLGVLDPSIGSIPPWIFNYPVLRLNFSGSRAQEIRSVEIVVSHSQADARPYLQLFSEDVGYGAITITSQGSSPIDGGVIEYDLIPIAANSPRYAPTRALRDSTVGFGTRRCPSSEHRTFTLDEVRAFLRQTEMGDREGRPYRFRDAVPAFERELLFAPLQNLVEAAPEIRPVMPLLAGIWSRGIHPRLPAINEAYIRSNADLSDGMSSDVIVRMAARCIPTEYLVDGRLTLQATHSGRQFSKTTVFRGILRFIIPEIGAPGASIDVANAMTFQIDGDNYRIRRYVAGTQSVELMLFSRESSEHAFHIEALGADETVLWTSQHFTTHLIVPGNSMEVLLRDSEYADRIPDYAR